MIANLFFIAYLPPAFPKSPIRRECFSGQARSRNPKRGNVPTGDQSPLGFFHGEVCHDWLSGKAPTAIALAPDIMAQGS
jgi:hypothetical protein